MVARLTNILKHDTAIAFIIACAWQLGMTLIGSMLLPDPSGKNIWFHTTLWDGGWYLHIIDEHYVTNPASPAFYPLFPLIVALLSFVTFNVFGYAAIGAFINTVALGFAIAALLTIARHFTITSRIRYLCVALFMMSPAAFFFHQFYGEAIFAAIGFWAYAFALQRKWLYVGILLAILTASRLPSLLFIGLCGLEFMRAYDWNIKKALNPKILYFLLAPLGFIAYGVYLLAARGDFLAMFNAYKATDDWTYQSFNLNFLSPIVQGGYEVLLALAGKAPLSSHLLVSTAFPLFSLTVLLASSIYLLVKIKGKGVPLGIFGLVSIIFFTLNDNLVSVHRYTLPCLGIYIALTLIYTRTRRLRPFVIGLALLTFGIQTLLIVWLYTTTKFVG